MREGAIDRLHRNSREPNRVRYQLSGRRRMETLFFILFVQNSAGRHQNGAAEPQDR